MLIGLGVCLAYRVAAQGQHEPTAADLERLVYAAQMALGDPIHQNFSSPFKRHMMHEFASEFFADLELDKHDGVPVGLLETLGYSAFGIPRSEHVTHPCAAA
jgi:hypothetical protein